MTIKAKIRIDKLISPRYNYNADRNYINKVILIMEKNVESSISVTAGKRQEFVDAAKGLGMLAVVWGHIMVSGWSFILVYAFDIPLFFFISGLLYDSKKYTSVGKLLKRRFKTLLVPYVIFSVVTWVIWVAYNFVLHNSVKIWPPLLQTVIAQGSGNYMIHNVPLWFVTCLFVVEVLYYFIAKLPDVWNVLICIGMAVIGHFMLNNDLAFDFTKLPWNIEAAMSAMLFYCAGNLLAKHQITHKLVKWVENNRLLGLAAVIVLTAVFTVGSLYNGHITLGSNLLGKNTFLLYINGFIGTFSAVVFSVLLVSCKNAKVVLPIKRYMSWIGKNSFYFMAVHCPIKGVLISVVAVLLHVSGTAVSNNIFYSLMVFVPTFVACTVVVMLINFFKNKFKKQGN